MLASTPAGEKAERATDVPPDSGLADFSLVAGGPLYRLLQRSGLTYITLSHLERPLLLAVLLTWVPLVVLSLWQGYAWRGVSVPLLLDGSVHMRLLVALPLLIAAESVAHDWMRPVPKRFIERSIIGEGSRARLEAAVKAAEHLRDSLYPELLIALAVLTVGIAVSQYRARLLETSTWYWPMPSAGSKTLAGWWFTWISLPLFQFLFLRWYFRLWIWVQFLWRVSRLELSLAVTHPDRAGGLGFLGSATSGFWAVLLAHGAISAAVIAHGLSFGGLTLAHYKVSIGILWAFTLLWVVAPLLVFLPTLAHAKRAGKSSYGFLAQRYASEFEQKWMSGKPVEERLLGDADIQSLADLGNGYRVVETMRFIPIGPQTLLGLMLIPLIPVVPLVLTLVPMDRLVSHLMTALF
jgi:hypothetical protein